MRMQRAETVAKAFSEDIDIAGRLPDGSEVKFYTLLTLRSAVHTVFGVGNPLYVKAATALDAVMKSRRGGA